MSFLRTKKTIKQKVSRSSSLNSIWRAIKIIFFLKTWITLESFKPGCKPINYFTCILSNRTFRYKFHVTMRNLPVFKGQHKNFNQFSIFNFFKLEKDQWVKQILLHIPHSTFLMRIKNKEIFLPFSKNLNLEKLTTYFGG